MAAKSGRWVSIQEMLNALEVEDEKVWDRLVGFEPIVISWPPKVKLTNLSR